MNNKSIARKLSRQFGLRMLATFVSMFLTLLLLVCIGFAVHFEQKIANAAVAVSRGDEWAHMPTDEHVIIEALPPDIKVDTRFHKMYAWILPRSTRSFPRSLNIYYSGGLQLHAYETAYITHDGITYRVTATSDAQAIFLIGVGALILTAYHAIVLMVASGKYSRYARRSLEPITELTRAAESLGRVKPENLIPINVGASLDKGDIKQLRGALETINAARLDTRLDVDGTQRELRELAATINGMLDRINDAYEAQVRFVSDASHELRTPIAVIQGYASLLDRWGKTDEKTLQEGIDAIRAEADSMKELVEQLLFLARGENRTITPELTQFDLAELAAELADEATLINTTHDFRLVAEPALVAADRGLIKQAARVLIDNATKYTDANGVITLKTAMVDDTAVFSVTDTGIGIDEELLPRIFDRFVRADESRTRASGGAGLGLSIAKWIVSHHGGHLDVLSRAGLGTRITIVLPSVNVADDAES